MRNIYLVRHGTPDRGTGEKRYIGVTDLPLSERGRQEAKKLGEFFAQEKKNVRIFTSPLKRCEATAGKVQNILEKSGSTGHTVEIMPDLKEIDLGKWDGVPARTIQESFPEEYAQRGKNIWTYRTPGGENFGEAEARFHFAVDEVRRKCDPDQNILIVSHAGVIRAYLTVLSGWDRQEVLNIPMPYGGITILEDAAMEGNPVPVRIGWKPESFLDEAEIERLYQVYRTPPHVVRHMKKVAETAKRMTDQIVTKADGIHPERIEKACLVHDLCRFEKNHAHVSAEALRKEGYPEIAEIVAQHHRYEYPPEEEQGPLTDAEILFLADKLVQEDRSVTIEERFAASRGKCRTEEALAHHDAMYRKSLLIEEKMIKEKYGNGII